METINEFMTVESKEPWEGIVYLLRIAALLVGCIIWGKLTQHWYNKK